MRLSMSLAVAVAALANGVMAVVDNLPSRPLNMRMYPPEEALSTAGHIALTTAGTKGDAYFQQYIDHRNKSFGTFSQHYWWNSQYCSKPGCPVVLFTPGEVNATRYQGYLTNATLTGQFAQAIGGAVVVLEHRYWGDSSPYAALTTENMRFQTLDNAISDLTNFAKTAKLPFDSNGASNAGKAPWVLSGGSYSGALSAWTASEQPGVFWAYHSSSAPVEAISDMWTYFYPVQDGMPKNCSTDLAATIDYIDGVFAKGDSKASTALKEQFGLGDLENDDFGAAIENGPWLWQGNQFTGNQGFFDFCDAVENVGKYAPPNTTTAVPGASGVGVQKALAGYARWFKTGFLPNWCAGYGYADWQNPLSTACFNTHNVTSPMYTDATLSNQFDRQWQWFLCNEPFGYWQDGAPKGRPSIVSRYVTADYWQGQCKYFFPTGANGATFNPKGRSEHDVNGRTRGWKLTNTTRLTWTNGQYDPWRSTSTSSVFRPGGPLQSTPQAPVNIVPGGYHCSDLRMANAAANPGVNDVVQKEIKQIAAWVKEWPGK